MWRPSGQQTVTNAVDGNCISTGSQCSQSGNNIDAPPRYEYKEESAPNPTDNHARGEEPEPPVPASRSSCIHVLYEKVCPGGDIETSRCYLFCKRVRRKHMEAAADSWEPPHWQWMCPAPFFPTYRQFARLVCVALVVLLLWGCAYTIVGEPFSPGGQLFGLAALTVAAHCGGWLVSLVTLPGLVGMLLTGILVQNAGLVQFSGEYRHVESTLRKVALVIILTRAGLDLDPRALKRLAGAVLKIGLLPWLTESVVMAVLFNAILEVPWNWCFLVSTVVAAVSPAVVVACLFRLRAKGYGVAKGIPTLIIAISGIDDAISVAAFGIIFSLLRPEGSLLYQIGQGPLSIVLGIGFGAAWGKMAKYIPEKNDPFAVPLRVLLLFAGGLISILGSEAVSLHGAGPLAVVAAAFVSCHSWSQQGWDVEENPVSTAFEIFWMVFEPILFGLTGTQIKLGEMNPQLTTVIVGCIAASFVIRVVATVGVAIRNNLNLKEKIFIALSLMSKASVQAALAPVPLDSLRDTEDEERAALFLTTCVLSILLTAPSVAALMTLLGPRLLTKTPLDPQFPENWRRHTRPSLRDITVLEGSDDNEKEGDETLARSKSFRRSSARVSVRRTGYDNNCAVICEDEEGPGDSLPSPPVA